MIEKLVSFILPDEMRRMTEEEILKFFPYAKEEVFGIRNEENHTIITISCKKKPFLIGKNASIDECLRATEKKIQKKESSYKNSGYGNKIIDGKEIPVFSYQYMIQGKKQMGKYGLCSVGRYFLAFTYVCGDNYKDFAEQKYDELLSTVIFE